MSIKHKIADALSTTCDRLAAGSGPANVSRFDMYLGDIDGFGDLRILYAEERARLAVPILVEEKRPDGDPVAITKNRMGLIVMFFDSFILARDRAFGTNKTEALGADEVSVEPVTATYEGSEMPGLRIRGTTGKPHLTAGLRLPRHEADPEELRAVRDEIVASILEPAADR